MDQRPSRIPVLARRLRPKPAAESPMTSPSKRQRVTTTSEPEHSVAPSVSSASNVPAERASTSARAANQGLPKSDKTVKPVSKKTVAKRPLTRYQLEAELESKNRLVETLKRQLARAKRDITKLREENKRLVHETEKLKRIIVEICLAILERGNIIHGSNAEEEKKAHACWEKISMLAQKLTEDLKGFGCTAENEKEMLQAAMARWKSAQEEDPVRALEKQTFRDQIEAWTTMLEELEKVLGM